MERQIWDEGDASSAWAPRLLLVKVVALSAESPTSAALLIELYGG